MTPTIRFALIATTMLMTAPASAQLLGGGGVGGALGGAGNLGGAVSGTLNGAGQLGSTVGQTSGRVSNTVNTRTVSQTPLIHISSAHLQRYIKKGRCTQ